LGKSHGSGAFSRVPLLLAGDLLGEAMFGRSSAAIAGKYSVGLGKCVGTDKTGFLAAVLFSFSLSGNYEFTLPDALIQRQI
jgi:hypothetical protein